MAVDKQGNTCLHRTKDKATIEYLADKEPELLTAKNRANQSLFKQMAAKNDVESLKKLMTKIEDNKEFPAHATDALFAAVYSGNPDIVKCLIAKGANVQATDSKGKFSINVR